MSTSLYKSLVVNSLTREQHRSFRSLLGVNPQKKHPQSLRPAASCSTQTYTKAFFIKWFYTEDPHFMWKLIIKSKMKRITATSLQVRDVLTTEETVDVSDLTRRETELEIWTFPWSKSRHEEQSQQSAELNPPGEHRACDGTWRHEEEASPARSLSVKWVSQSALTVNSCDLWVEWRLVAAVRQTVSPEDAHHVTTESYTVNVTRDLQ